jgi:signal transduction histidine kinase
MTTHRTARRLLAAALVSACGQAVAAPDWEVQAGIAAGLVWVATLAGCCCLLLRRCLHAEDRAVRLAADLCLEQQARCRAEQALADNHAVLKKLVREQSGVRDAERGRIARDIHDDLGQNLLALRIELSLMQVATCGIHPAIHQKLGGLMGCLDHAMRSLRAVINDLRPLALDEGLRCALERQLNEFSRINDIAHELIVEPGALDMGPRSPEVDAMLYRILQEALSNVARHAHASLVRVILGHDGERLILHVHDNGVGMAATPSGCGCGLAGMRERIGAAGGLLSIKSEPGTGTLLSLSIPLEHESVAR